MSPAAVGSDQWSAGGYIGVWRRYGDRFCEVDADGWAVYIRGLCTGQGPETGAAGRDAADRALRAAGVMA